MMLEIKNLTVAVEEQPILCGFNLQIAAGQVHAIMGPNGAGKSTLARVLAGHPSYEILEGEVWFRGQNLLDMDPEERSHAGLFMSFQYPVEVPGVNTAQFLKVAVNSNRKARSEKELSDSEFEQLLAEKMQLMHIKPEFKNRNINEGSSGGEKKKNEILQMDLLDPFFSILDETDSGLDIDAIDVVASGVNRLVRGKEDKALLLITHYQRLLDYIQPHFVHVMMKGKIVLSGGPELALELESKGYNWLEKMD